MVLNLVILIGILLIFAFFSTKIGSSVIDYFSFFVDGQKYSFSVSELHLLWRVGKNVNLKNKSRLFWSVNALQEAITFLTTQVERVTDGTEKAKLTSLLSKLYDFRTKVELETVQKKRGLEHTSQIKQGQICVLVFPHFGQFYANVTENNSKSIQLRSIGELPMAFNFKATDEVSIYLWREGDAGYLIKSHILNITQTNAGTIFNFSHSKDIIRTQKRKSVRAKADFQALLFPQHPDTPANVLPESVNGVKCNIKDISEDGALVFARGKCVKGMRAKLQFRIADKDIVMFVKAIRFVYSTSQNISKIHFHSEKISAEDKNAILSYVYEIVHVD